MTHTEWLASDNPAAMLQWLTSDAPRKPSPRQLRARELRLKQGN